MPKRNKNMKKLQRLIRRVKCLENEVSLSRNVGLIRYAATSTMQEPRSQPEASQDNPQRVESRTQTNYESENSSSDDEIKSIIEEQIPATRPEPIEVTAVVQDPTVVMLSSVNPAQPATATADALPADKPETVAKEKLDEDLLEILGTDPSKNLNYGPNIQTDVAVRFEHYTTKGLSEQDRLQLTKKHPTPNNCKLIDAPTLNPEIKAALADNVLASDKTAENEQKQTATALSSLGKAITHVMLMKEKQPDLLRLLFEAGRILCDRQHGDSQKRRDYILSYLRDETKDHLKNTQIDQMLFGENLLDTLEMANAIKKSGAHLKAGGSEPDAAARNDKRKAANSNDQRQEPSTSAAAKNARSSTNKTSEQTRSGRR